MDENYIILRSFKRMEMISDVSLSPFSLGIRRLRLFVDVIRKTLTLELTLKFTSSWTHLSGSSLIDFKSQGKTTFPFLAYQNGKQYGIPKFS